MIIAQLYRCLIPKRIRAWIHDQRLEIQEIHIERIEQPYKKLFKFCRKHLKTLLMPSFSIEDPSPKVLDLYEKLINTFNNHTFGLHVHISGGLYSSPPPPLQDFETQYDIISKAYNNLRQLGISSSHFTSGNWNYNYDTLLVCEKLHLNYVHTNLKKFRKLLLDTKFRGESI